MSYAPVEPELHWLGTRRFWIIVLVVAVCAGLWVGGRSLAVAARRASPVQAVLYGQDQLTPSLPATFRVLVRDSRDGRPLPGAEVALALVAKDGTRVELGGGRTDQDGFAVAERKLPPDLEDGDYRVEVRTRSRVGTSSFERGVTVRRSFRTLVTTDKPIYQPGQVIHIRTLTLATADQRPASGQAIVVEVQDAKGNKVFKKLATTSDFGIASADFELADQVNTGDYTLSATVGDTTSTKGVQVSRYVLPKFRVDLTPERGYYGPGETVHADLVAEYTFGKPVAGAAVQVIAKEMVESLQPFATADGQTDQEGRWHLVLPLKESFVGQELTRGDAFVTLEATVTDTAGHAQTKTVQLTVSAQPLRVELLPESGELVQGVANQIFVLTAYPDGRPAQTTVRCGPPVGAELTTSELGVAELSVTPTGSGLSLEVTAEDRQGARVSEVKELRVGERSDAFLLRTDRPVYEVGQTAVLEVLSAAPSARVFVDVVRDRRTVLMTALDVAAGRGRADLDLSEDFLGTLELHAYRVLGDGTLVRDTRVVQVNRAEQLSLELGLDRSSYRPAEKAVLDVLVKTSAGSPTQAALGLSGIDEAVFALSDMKPGLEAVYFTLQAELLKPRYEIHAQLPVTPDLITTSAAPLAPAQEQARRALFSLAEGTGALQADADVGFAEKQQRVAEEQQKYFRGLQARGLRLPLYLFALLVVPAAGYAVLRLFRRQAVTATEAEHRELKRATGSLLRRWWLAFWMPPLGAIAAGFAADAWHLHPTARWAIVALAALALLALVDLLLAVRRVRRSAAAASLPLLRKVVACLPWAFLAALAAAATAAVAVDENLIERTVIVAQLVSVVALAALTAGFLAVGRSCALRPTGVLRWLYLAVSRPILFVLPLLVVGVATFAPARRAVLDMPLAAEIEERGVAAFKEQVLEGAMLRQAMAGDKMENEALAPTAAEAQALKAPTRIRSFFPETLFWQPELVTDEGGRARLEIALADSITTWRVAASAVSRHGELGSATTGLQVFQDFFVDIDFPVALTQHDEVSVPVAVYNYLDGPQTVRLEAEAGDWATLLEGASRSLEIGPHEVTSVSFRLRAEKPGRHALTVKAAGSRLADAVRREVTVTPDGQPVVQTVNGRLGENVVQEVSIPAQAIDGASDLYVKVYPGAFSQVVEGLDSIFQMPFGCFEQTSSTTYPNVLVLDYLRRTKQAKPEIELKALSYINLGYQRLLSYEVPGGGFEWFGRPPAHTVLTAYGLLEFSDMAKVSEVDPAVIERTRAWLYAQQQSDGSFEPTAGGIAEGAINRFQGAGFRTTAYVAWALAGSGDRGAELDRALDHLRSGWSQSNDDPYTLSLVAAALVAAERPADAKPVLDRLEALKVVDRDTVHWSATSEGVTYGGGDALDVETTAVVAQAMLSAGGFVGTAHKALAWLVEHKDPSGTWFSTQATVQAMRALLGGTGAGGGVDQTLNVTVTANDQVAKELEITPETADVFRLVDLRPLVREGANRIALEASAPGNLAYQIVATHYLPWVDEAAGEEQELELEVAYDRTALATDDLLGCQVTVRYNRPGVAKMTIVDLGIPPGFEVVAADFDVLKEQGVIQRYSLTGRQVILYFDTITGDQPVSFHYQLKAKFPVKAQAPASRAYQYYQPEVRDQTRPVEITVS